MVRWSSSDYQIAPIAARSTAMGRWRLTPPGYWGDTACGRKLECFVPRHEYLSFFAKRKVPKKTTQTYGLRIPWRGAGKCKFGGVYSRAGCSGHHCRSKGLCLRSPARRLPRPLAPATVGVFASTGLAIIKSRLCRRKAAKVGVPVGHGYNYFLACDTVERMFFTVVTGSGSGKLCWHSRGNDSDQENAGYVRESAGGSEQA